MRVTVEFFALDDPNDLGEIIDGAVDGFAAKLKEELHKKYAELEGRKLVIIAELFQGGPNAPRENPEG